MVYVTQLRANALSVELAQVIARNVGEESGHAGTLLNTKLNSTGSYLMVFSSAGQHTAFNARNEVNPVDTWERAASEVGALISEHEAS